MDEHLLASYLHDHLTAAYGAASLAGRVAGSHDDPRLVALAAEVQADVQALQGIARAFGIGTAPERRLLAQAGELLGRLKPNGSWLHRTPVTDLVELEALRALTAAKQTSWRSLRAAAEGDERLDAEMLDRSIEQAGEQLSLLDEVRDAVARTAFSAKES